MARLRSKVGVPVKIFVKMLHKKFCPYPVRRIMKVIATTDKMLSETETEFTYNDGIQVRFINSIPIQFLHKSLHTPHVYCHWLHGT